MPFSLGLDPVTSVNAPQLHTRLTYLFQRTFGLEQLCLLSHLELLDLARRGARDFGEDEFPRHLIWGEVIATPLA